MKKCTKCGRNLPLDAYYQREYKGKRVQRMFYVPSCKECQAAYERQKYPQRREMKLEVARKHSLMKRYGISHEDFIQMSKAQGDVCYICKRPEPTKSRLSVDHCHKTGRVRKLLCTKCNTALGAFNDDPELLRKAANYLESVKNVKPIGVTA